MYRYDKGWYNKLNKSKLTPPSWIFSVVWSFLYMTLLISFIYIKKNKKCVNYCEPLIYFTIQVVLNILWTTLFFKLKTPIIALLDIILIIIFTMVTIKKFYKIDKFASYILIPYLVWIIFALYLNIYIVLFN